MAQPEARYSTGDVVAHPRRPEWGSGVVKQAQVITHEGRPAQRLSVDFANKGRVVINTALAPLTLRTQRTPLRPDPGPEGARPEEEDAMARIASSPTPASGSAAHGSSTGGAGGWLSQLERANGHGGHELWGLPQACNDPFEPLHKRLQATLETYKFSTEPRSLIDWAVIQTGLNDPLSKYTRSELEQAFPRFARDRDDHLKDLVRQIKRKGDAAQLAATLSQTKLPAAINALQRAMRA